MCRENGIHGCLRPKCKKFSKSCRSNSTVIPLNPVDQASIDWRFCIFCLGLFENAHLALAQLGRSTLPDL